MKFRMDSLHYALLAIIVLLAVYYATRFFREGTNDLTAFANQRALTEREAKEGISALLTKP